MIKILEPTLSYLGLHLADVFNINRKQVGYSDKEAVFRHLREQTLPLTLPAVTFCNSTINFINLGGTTRKNAIFSGSANLNQTLISRYNVSPVTLEISIAIISSNIKDYFNSIKSYAGLFKRSLFSVPINMGKDTISIEIPISNIQSLSTPPEGKEAQDYDRGIFYVNESTFTINSGILFNTEDKLIREVVTDSLPLTGFELNIV